MDFSMFDNFVQQLPFVAVMVSVCIWFYIQNGKSLERVENRHADRTDKAHEIFAQALTRINDESKRMSEAREDRLAGLVKRVISDLDRIEQRSGETQRIVIKTLAEHSIEG